MNDEEILKALKRGSKPKELIKAGAKKGRVYNISRRYKLMKMIFTPIEEVMMELSNRQVSRILGTPAVKKVMDEETKRGLRRGYV